MPDLTNESTGVNYAKRDASAERLWLTQRTKVNPWDHRTPSDDDGGPADRGTGNPGKDHAPAAPMISQVDTLALDGNGEDPPPNPFEVLLKHPPA